MSEKSDFLTSRETEEEQQKTEELLEQRIYFENLIFSATEKDMDEIKSLINNFPKNWVQTFVSRTFTPFRYKILGDIFALTGKSVIKFNKYNPVSHYLFARKLINDDDFDEKGSPYQSDLKPIEVYEHPIEPGSIWDCVHSDNISSFVEYIEVHNLDINTNEVVLNDWKFNIITLACFSGSINIVKYLMLNGMKIKNDAIGWAVSGGSEELMDFFSSKGFSFHHFLLNAIQFHHNSIARWLVENYNDDFAKVMYCAMHFNTELLIFFVNDLKWHINDQDLKSRRTALHWAVMNNDLLETKFLLSKGADKNRKDYDLKKPIAYAKDEEIIKILE